MGLTGGMPSLGGMMNSMDSTPNGPDMFMKGFGSLIDQADPQYMSKGNVMPGANPPPAMPNSAMPTMGGGLSIPAPPTNNISPQQARALIDFLNKRRG